jgi:hypothetical protein
MSNKKDWYAPPELAGTLKVKVGHTQEEIADKEALAESLGWKVTPHGTCSVCERIKREGKSK